MDDPLMRAFWPGGWQSYGLDIVRHDDGYDIEVPTPGFRKEDLDVTYQDGVVTVSGRTDRRSIRRSFSLPEDVDENTITAEVENGVLTLHLKQQPSRQPRRIAISGSSGRSSTGTVDTRKETPIT